MKQPVAGGSRLKENYGRYNNYGHHASGQATMNIYQSNQLPPSPTVFDLLRPDYVQDALYNSSKRWAEHAVTCQPETRDRILDEVRSWADSRTPLVCWLSGPAGTGKTTVAHTIAKEYDERGQLAATFFLWRKTGDRDDINKIVPTLAYQIAKKIPSAKERMEENLILKDGSRALLMDPPSRLSFEDQLSKLLITIVNPTDPNLIVIDGLDECSSREGICQLIEWIRKNKSPFRFLLTSRPEREFQRRILSDGHGDVRTLSLSLTESKEDIRKYFVERLEEVWPKQQRIEDGGPLQWPSELYLDTLVEKSGGLFVYAATAIRYIGGEGLPQQRLENVLVEQLEKVWPKQQRIKDGGPLQWSSAWYRHLYALYDRIFGSVESYGQLEKICLVLGILYVRSKAAGFFSRHATIEELLDMKTGDLVLLLDPILSLVAIDGDNIRILHKSLMDYLLDSAQRGYLPFDFARVHEAAATYILQQRILNCVCSKDDFRLFAFHCRYAHLNDTLKDYLHSLEVPCPKHIMSIIEISPFESVIEQNQDLILTPWSFFRILSREDFDSTGRLYEQYMGKWEGYLRGRTVGATVTNVDRLKGLLKPRDRLPVAKEDELKRKLDTVLMNWNPPSFKPMSIGVAAVRRDAFIKREHKVLLAYTEALYSGETNTIAWSLIFGDRFVHSYVFGFPDDDTSFLIVRTYSRHTSACHQLGYFGTFDIAQQTESYLRVAERYFGSTFFQMYGLDRDEVTSNST